jgi:hypothetical protein
MNLFLFEINGKGKYSSGMLPLTELSLGILPLIELFLKLLPQTELFSLWYFLV